MLCGGHNRGDVKAPKKKAPEHRIKALQELHLQGSSEATFLRAFSFSLSLWASLVKAGLDWLDAVVRETRSIRLEKWPLALSSSEDNSKQQSSQHRGR